MDTFSKGDRVMATKNLGRGVNKGAVGVVIAVKSWTSNFVVSFGGTEIAVFSVADVAKL